MKNVSLLAHNHLGTKQECVHIICVHGIDDPDAVQVRQFGFGFTGSLRAGSVEAWRNWTRTNHSPFKAESVDDVLHSLNHPVILAAYAFTSLDGGTVGAVEDE